MYTLKFAERVDLMLSIFITHTQHIHTQIITKEAGRKTFGGNGYIQVIDCCDVYTDAYLQSNSSSRVHLCQSYFNKRVKKIY